MHNFWIEIFVTGGYLPKDAPSPVTLHRSKAETVIAAFTAAIGILSTMFFLLFNICYRKHLYVFIRIHILYSPSHVMHIVRTIMACLQCTHLHYKSDNVSCRVVKRSSYRLNCVILSGILMGFIGTTLYTIEPDDNTGHVVSTLVCNVSNFNSSYLCYYNCL